MKTAKKRFHVSLTKSEEEVLIKLSKKEGIPVATKASELLSRALDLYEDEILLERLNERRNKKINWVKLEDYLDENK